MNPALENIMTRVSVRRFTDAPVSDESVTSLLRAAMAAPTGVNKQPWEFYVIKDAQVRARLADALPYAKMAAHAPVVIVVCGNRQRFLEGVDSVLWEQDLSAASENILLAAHALGLGGVWTCVFPHQDRMDPVRDILRLPDNIVPFSLIPVGHPEAERPAMDKWHPERIHII